MQMHNKEVLDMRSQADLLYNEQNCYSEQNSVEENCTFDQYTALRDNSCATSDRYVKILVFKAVKIRVLRYLQRTEHI